MMEAEPSYIMSFKLVVVQTMDVVQHNMCIMNQPLSETNTET
jgi:hypothetical protein